MRLGQQKLPKLFHIALEAHLLHSMAEVLLLEFPSLLGIQTMNPSSHDVPKLLEEERSEVPESLDGLRVQVGEGDMARVRFRDLLPQLAKVPMEANAVAHSIEPVLLRQVPLAHWVQSHAPGNGQILVLLDEHGLQRLECLASHVSFVLLLDSARQFGSADLALRLSPLHGEHVLLPLVEGHFEGIFLFGLLRLHDHLRVIPCEGLVGGQVKLAEGHLVVLPFAQRVIHELMKQLHQVTFHAIFRTLLHKRGLLQQSQVVRVKGLPGIQHVPILVSQRELEAEHQLVRLPVEMPKSEHAIPLCAQGSPAVLHVSAETYLPHAVAELLEADLSGVEGVKDLLPGLS
mmetsp:Transcript_55737/g.130017  ORF Transcript_55737/g.130017 Transcript_55737/m.130017 type:complete len:345 (+) Transcript_55737:1813-2847(+)